MRRSLASLLLPAAALVLPAAALVLPACGDDPPPGCVIEQETTLVSTPLTTSRNAVLHRAGTGFVLAAMDGDTVRWARLAFDGALSDETTLTVPPRVLGPWFGVAGKTAPADQLLVTYAVEKPGSTQLEMQLIAQDLGATEGSAPKRLFDVAAGAERAALRVQMMSSRTGRRAGMVFGVEGQPGPLYVVLGHDGEPVAAPAPLYRRDDSKPEVETAPRGWRCLAFVPGRADLAVSIMEPPSGGNAEWRLFELRDDASRGTEINLLLMTKEADCPVVAPTPSGYALAWQNRDGTFFTQYHLATSSLDNDIVAGANRFGGPEHQPPLGSIAASGKEFALTFARRRGPEVWRFDAFGDKRGSALLLRSQAGNPGPLSAWPADDRGVYITYLDQPAPRAKPENDSTNRRVFTRVDCLADDPDTGNERDAATVH